MAASGTQPLRLVLDTNVVVAGQLWNGPPRRLIELAIEGEAVEFFSSPVLLDELAHTLGYSKFAARIEGFGTSIAVLVAQSPCVRMVVAPIDLVSEGSVSKVVVGGCGVVVEGRCGGQRVALSTASRPVRVSASSTSRQPGAAAFSPRS